MPSPSKINVEIAEGIIQKLAAKGELSVDKTTALYSITTGFTTKTIKTIIENLAKADFITVRGDKILPFS